MAGFGHILELDSSEMAGFGAEKEAERTLEVAAFEPSELAQWQLCNVPINAPPDSNAAIRALMEVLRRLMLAALRFSSSQLLLLLEVLASELSNGASAVWV